MSEQIGLARPLISEAEQEAVQQVLRSGQLASGPRVKAFEEAFAAFSGCRYGVATTNGTTALAVALQAAGVQPEDEVITSPFTFIATANSIMHVGARPVFADIDPLTYNLDPESVAAVLKEYPRAKALLIVHLYGQACDMARLMPLVERHGLILVEDCAQAHGASHEGILVGSFGRAAAFSFYATKNMTTGEGGMVTTNSPDVAEKVRKLVNHGRAGQYYHDEIGYNHRMTDLAAAIGLVQLGRLPGFNERRRVNAAYLDRRLAGLPQVRTPMVAPGATHVYHQYTIRAERRDQLRESLLAQGVGSGVIYPIPLHQQPPYARLLGHLSLPYSEEAAQQVLSLPVHPGLTEHDLERVAGAVREFYGLPLAG